MSESVFALSNVVFIFSLLLTCSVGNYDRYLRDFMKQHWELVEGRVNPLNLEDATFKGLPTLIKVEILHSLCDFRLDAADVSLLKVKAVYPIVLPI